MKNRTILDENKNVHEFIKEKFKATEQKGLWKATTKKEAMSIVNILDVNCLNNPCRMSEQFNFEITFECIAPLKEGIRDNCR